MQEIYRQILESIKAINLLVILFVLFVPIENLFALKPKRIFRKQFWDDVFILLFNSFIERTIVITIFALIIRYLANFRISFFESQIQNLPLWAYYLLALMIGEISAYWAHRFLHKVPLLWRFHKIHHAAEEMDWLVNIRVHPVEMIFMRCFQFIPLYLLGFLKHDELKTTSLLVFIPIIGVVWGYFIHSNIRVRFGFLEKIVTTPAFHHWHHTNDDPNLYDKNYSSMLPVFDIIFGSFYLPKGKSTRTFGINEKVPKDFSGMMQHPFVIKKKMNKDGKIGD